jgi:cell division septation protein DedD
MAASQDTEITLGTAKLLGLFVGLVVVCAVFFSLGYVLGRKSDNGPTAAIGRPLQSAPGVKPSSSASNTPMTFYKAVEQKDANAQLTPASENDNGSAGVTQTSDSQSAASDFAKNELTANLNDPMSAAPANGYLVQVAAVSKQDDAEALVDALKKKQYPAFTANNINDKLFRVQIGPFADIKAAETVRAHLVDDGYNPILKK